MVPAQQPPVTERRQQTPVTWLWLTMERHPWKSGAKDPGARASVQRAPVEAGKGGVRCPGVISQAGDGSRAILMMTFPWGEHVEVSAYHVRGPGDHFTGNLRMAVLHFSVIST